jgi:hypothetical protein
VLRVAIPAGLIASAATLVAFTVSRQMADVSLDEARTTATLTLLGIGLVLLALVARPLNRLRRMLVGGLAAAFAAVLVLPPLRTFFALDPQPAGASLLAAGLIVVAGLLLTLVVKPEEPAETP